MNTKEEKKLNRVESVEIYLGELISAITELENFHTILTCSESEPLSKGERITVDVPPSRSFEELWSNLPNHFNEATDRLRKIKAKLSLLIYNQE